MGVRQFVDKPDVGQNLMPRMHVIPAADVMADGVSRAGSIEERLEKIEGLLAAMLERQQVLDWYSTEQFARRVGKAEFTVREWARLGRIKRKSGRGAYTAWVMSHEELLQYQREGLRPLPIRR
jgi:hypothetical protein